MGGFQSISRTHADSAKSTRLTDAVEKLESLSQLGDFFEAKTASA
jgi:hypothetical protein